jgi:transposase-like protein
MARPRQYSSEFRQRAIRMVAESAGGFMRRIASQLGVSYETLHKWVDRAARGAARSAQRECGAASRQRDLEIGLGLFRPRARPTSAERTTHIQSE